MFQLRRDVTDQTLMFNPIIEISIFLALSILFVIPKTSHLTPLPYYYPNCF